MDTGCIILYSRPDASTTVRTKTVTEGFSVPPNGETQSLRSRCFTLTSTLQGRSLWTVPGS